MRPLFAILALLASAAVCANGNDDLLAAAPKGDAAAIAAALQAGADANAVDANGISALMFAVASGKADAVSRLLDAHADIDAHAGRERMTALDIALDRQQWNMAEQLLAGGASLTESVTGRDQALHKLLDLSPVLHPRTMTLVQAAELPSPTLFRAVLAQGASTGFVDDKGNTLLMLAAKRHHTTAMAALLAAGADVRVRNAEGDTALSIAAGKTEYELMVIGVGLALGQTRDSLMKLVFRPASKSNESLSTARRLETVQLLLAAHADPNVADAGGNTPLLEATRSGDVELVSLLIGA
ncbi:MAG: ankyrin repeat domain-containing protein, partial [Steroidobacteraceae bacterium]